MSEVNALIEFLTLDTRLDVKSLALQQILSLSGSKEGRHLMLQVPKVFHNLCLLMSDKQASVATDASLALINFSSDEESVPVITQDETQVIDIALKVIIDPEHELADPCCMLLSNITRISLGSQRVFDKMLPRLDAYIDAFCQEKFNKRGAGLHYLASVFSNMSQIPEMRSYILDHSRCTLQRLVSFTDYKHSTIRRGGIIGLIKNCCFQTEHHDWLLSESVDLLPKLLLPLAGPEELNDEENEKLPIELQYLGDDKTREEDPDIRKMLLEALIQLCTTRDGREYLRSKNTYVILRELHKWEKNQSILAACEHLVNILIRYEHEIGCDNLKELEVPTELADKFEPLE